MSGHYYWAVGWDDEDVSNPNHWLKHASGADKHDHVMKITQSLEPKFREIFPLTPVDGILPGQAVYRDAEIPSLRTGRIVLVGDAAHPMTPCKSASPNASGVCESPEAIIDNALQFEVKVGCRPSETHSIYQRHSAVLILKILRMLGSR